MMTFHEPTSWAMVVMDGNRPIAKARKKGIGWWLLSLEGGCWIDPRARQPLRDDHPSGFEPLWPKLPQFLAVKTRSEARSIMKALVETGR